MTGIRKRVPVAIELALGRGLMGNWKRVSVAIELALRDAGVA